MNIDLGTLSRKELEKLKANVEKALEKVSAREMKAAREAAEKAAAAHGFTLAEIAGPKAAPVRQAKGKSKARNATKAGVAKYANPADPSQTWTGKGRQPNWFRAAMDAGVKPETLEIK